MSEQLLAVISLVVKTVTRYLIGLIVKAALTHYLCGDYKVKEEDAVQNCESCKRDYLLHASIDYLLA